MVRLPLNFKCFGTLAPLALALALVLATGCKTKTAAPPTDQQIATEVQAKLTAEPALSGQSIQVSVTNGVASLNGSVTSDAARVLAGNETGTIGGVKTVVNNLTVEQAQTPAQIPPPESAPPPPQFHKPAAHHETASAPARSRPVYTPVQPPQQQQPVPAQVAQTQAPPPPPPAPPKPVVKQITLAAGTVIPVRITESIDSKTAQPNDAFHGSLAGDLASNGVVAIPRGAPILGRVVDAKEAAHFKGSSLLTLELTQVSAHGQRFSLVTDTYSKQGTARGKNTAEKTGAGAAFGAIIGALAGGGKGAAIGGLAGAGAGAGINAATRGQQVVIPTETVINFRLQSPVTVTVTFPPPGAEQEMNPDPTLQHR